MAGMTKRRLDLYRRKLLRRQPEVVQKLRHSMSRHRPNDLFYVEAEREARAFADWMARHGLRDELDPALAELLVEEVMES